MTSGRPDQASLLSGCARGPRLGFEVNVRIGIRSRSVTLFLHILFLLLLFAFMRELIGKER